MIEGLDYDPLQTDQEDAYKDVQTCQINNDSFCNFNVVDHNRQSSNITPNEKKNHQWTEGIIDKLTMATKNGYFSETSHEDDDEHTSLKNELAKQFKLALGNVKIGAKQQAKASTTSRLEEVKNVMAVRWERSGLG